MLQEERLGFSIKSLMGLHEDNGIGIGKGHCNKATSRASDYVNSVCALVYVGHKLISNDFLDLSSLCFLRKSLLLQLELAHLASLARQPACPENPLSAFLVLELWVKSEAVTTGWNYGWCQHILVFK